MNYLETTNHFQKNIFIYKYQRGRYDGYFWLCFCHKNARRG